jgi:hypothetical protein
MRAHARRLVTHEAVVFSDDERAQYEGLAAEEADGDSYMHALAKLLRLRMACIHPRLQQCRAALRPGPDLALPRPGLGQGATLAGGGMPMMQVEDAVVTGEGLAQVMTTRCTMYAQPLLLSNQHPATSMAQYALEN